MTRPGDKIFNADYKSRSLSAKRNASPNLVSYRYLEPTQSFEAHIAKSPKIKSPKSPIKQA
jgi:hypothetical protein